MRVTLAVGLIAACFGVGQVSADEAESSNGFASSVRVKLKMGDAKAVSLQIDDQGSYHYIVVDNQGTHQLTPDQFAARLYNDHASRSFFDILFNITSPIGIAWVTLGFVGQAMFTGRMLVQWIASERSRRSIVPVAFWWMSIAGGIMLLVYFLWRKDIVGVIGQSVGISIYSRNLVLISSRRKAA